MQRIRGGGLGVLFSWLAWAGSALADPAPPPAQPIERYRLANGLRVVLAPDHVTGGVSVVVRYEVGSAEDPRQYRGLSHLLEHLTYRGSRHLAPLENVAVLQRQGADFNGVTSSEATTYWTRVAPSGLESVLWLEAERMAFTLDGVDQRALATEKGVVINELRQRHSSLGAHLQPYWAHALYGDAHPFTSAPDEVADVQAVTLPVLRWFFQATYRPENATLVLVGDFAPEQARALVARYFAEIVPAGVAPLSVRAAPPQLCGVHRLDISHGALFGRLLRITWPLPVATTPAQRVAAQVVDEVLQRRLYRVLVKERAEVATLQLSRTEHETHSLLTVQLGLHADSRDKSIEATTRRLAEELGRTPLNAGELRFVRSNLLSRIVFEREDGLGRARALSAGRDPDREVEALLSLSAEEVRRAAQPLSGPLLVLRAWPSTRHHGDTRVEFEEDPCR